MQTNTLSTLEREEPIKSYDEAEAGKLVRTIHGLHRIYEVSRDSYKQVIVITGLQFYDDCLYQINIFPDSIIRERIIPAEDVQFNKYKKFLEGFESD